MLGSVRAPQTMSTPPQHFDLYAIRMSDSKEWMKMLLVLAHAKNLRDADVARLIGVTRSTFCSWKTRGIPLERLEDAARSVETTIEYLKTGLDVARFHHQLTEEERQILASIKLLDKEDRKRLLQPVLNEADRIRRYQSGK